MRNENIVINFGEEQTLINPNKIKYPIAAIFHLFFRYLSIIIYFICAWLTNSFIISFIIILVLLALDFWTVKNITGRLLVGLRWWNFVDENGENHWIFESRKSNPQNMNYIFTTLVESQIFWIGLMLSPLIWILLFFIALFTLKFKWMLIVSLGILLNGANLYGYIRCKMGDNSEIKTTFSNFFYSKMIGNFFSSSFKNKMTTPKTQSQEPTNIFSPNVL
ncbi:unnamed protein product [Gordionus sp. m RMFG-2023]|uniref:Golgi apparatus membrane protein TVP23 homolog A-like isoform X2 n=1 Tax=Gordionus sp. m RMFG-2023 TaxID=3053472 RepID=UPI0030E0F1A6